MRISSSWLSELVALPPPERLDAVFEMAGIGVENHSRQNGDDLWTLEVTSNRGDCLSASGLAREISAMNGGLLHLPHAEVAETGEPIEGRLAVEINDADDCPRYVARLIEDVHIGDSPPWMQERLLACGMRPINNVVDITNYVMLETGQPLHAFDADKVQERRIVVRRATAGEKLVTLDGVERELSDEVLLIADAQKALGIAGVMGGLESEVTPQTRRILLEAAHFSPLRVRRSARALRLATEASRRFERWVDPNAVARAAERAAGLLEQFAGATVAQGAIDVYPKPVAAASVELPVDRCNQMLGLGLTAHEIADLVQRLRLEVTRHDEQSLTVLVPTWRRDISRPVDLMEEVARLYGYDNIPASLPPGSNRSAGLSLAQQPEQKARDILLRCGLNEVVTLSLENQAAVGRAGLTSQDDAVTLRNPLSEDFTRLRTSLLPSVLQVLANNSRRYSRPIGIFEIGRTYHHKAAAQQPLEKLEVAVAIADAPPPRHWQGSGFRPDFYSLKAVVSQLLRELGAPSAAFSPARRSFLHPGRCAVVSLQGQEVGCLGELHPDVAERYELKHRGYVALIDFAAVLPHVALVKHYVSQSRQPAAQRDLALLVPSDVPADAVQETVRHAGAPLLESARVFDVYIGNTIAEGFKSVALELSFRAADRTLEDVAVDGAMQSIMEAARDQLGAEVRS